MKRIAFVLALVLLLLPVSVYATGSVEFTGKGFAFAPGSEYTTTDLFDGLKNVMPGDELIQQVTVTNTARGEQLRLWMSVEPHDEPEDVEFLKALAMEIRLGDRVLFTGTAGDATEDRILLGTIPAGKSITLTVKLTAQLELDNRYADRVGETDWIFHGESAGRPPTPATRKTWASGCCSFAARGGHFDPDLPASEKEELNLLRPIPKPGMGRFFRPEHGKFSEKAPEGLAISPVFE